MDHDTHDTQTQKAVKRWGLAISTNPKYETVELVESEIVFGRGGDCQIRVCHPAISGQHCRISRQSNGVVFVKDLSTNGTFVNGEKVGKSHRILITNGTEVALIQTPTEKISYLVCMDDEQKANEGPENDYQLRELLRSEHESAPNAFRKEDNRPTDKRGNKPNFQDPRTPPRTPPKAVYHHFHSPNTPPVVINVIHHTSPCSCVDHNYSHNHNNSHNNNGNSSGNTTNKKNEDSFDDLDPSSQLSQTSSEPCASINNNSNNNSNSNTNNSNNTYNNIHYSRNNKNMNMRK